MFAQRDQILRETKKRLAQDDKQIFRSPERVRESCL